MRGVSPQSAETVGVCVCAQACCSSWLGLTVAEAAHQVNSRRLVIEDRGEGGGLSVQGLILRSDAEKPGQLWDLGQSVQIHNYIPLQSFNFHLCWELEQLLLDLFYKKNLTDLEKQST